MFNLTSYLKNLFAGPTRQGYVLYLAEKPSQARRIAEAICAHDTVAGGYMGDGVAVTWCYGHMFVACPPEHYLGGKKQWSLDDLPIVPEEWQFKVKEKSEAQLANIGHLLAGARAVVIATDPDAEGEVIGRQVLGYFGWDGPVARLWLSALEPERLREAIAHPLPLAETESYYRVGIARQRLDWLFGMNLTRAFTLTLGCGTAVVGRVLTPMLAMIVERDREIASFQPAAYFEVDAVIRTGDDSTFPATWMACGPDGSADYEAAFAALTALDSEPLAVELISTYNISVPPPDPYSLASLQSDASATFGMTAAQVDAAAQSLYEAGMISYPRTDSTALPGHAGAHAPHHHGAHAFAAHHAIIPVPGGAGADLTPAQASVYGLIAARHEAQSLPAYSADAVTYGVMAGDVMFLARARDIVEPGWTTAYEGAQFIEEERFQQRSLPELSHDTALKLKSANITRKFTEPPPHYSDGELISVVTRFGLGTPATRASIIEKLVRVGLAKRGDGGRLQATPKGRNLSDALPAGVKDVKFTARMQEGLGSVQEGESTVEAFVGEQLDRIAHLLEEAIGRQLEISHGKNR